MGVTPSFFIEKTIFLNKIKLYLEKMSREEFKNFIKTAKKNVSVKNKLVTCKTSKDLILLAKKYGYTINFEDLIYDKTATKFERWFKESTIKPLK
tara:strand:- start:335 stop:619 length:285 start_codon:yes stop_codon:yes gene_type:complete